MKLSDDAVKNGKRVRVYFFHNQRDQQSGFQMDNACIVVWPVISFISCSHFAINTIDEDGLQNNAMWGGMRMGKRCWVLMPLNDDFGIGKWGFGGKVMVEGAEIERLNILFFLGQSV